MAEIRVAGRRHRLWPWVLGLLLLLLLVWALVMQAGRGGDDIDVRDDGTRLGSTPERPAPTATPQEPQEPPRQPEAERRDEAAGPHAHHGVALSSTSGTHLLEA